MNNKKIFLKTHSRKAFFIAVIIFIILTIYAANSYAVDIWSIITGNNDLKTFYANNAKIMKNHSVGGDVLRIVLWGVTSLLAYVAHLCGGLYDTAFGFVDWTTNGMINNYVDSFKPLFVGLMALSLFYLGIVLIVQHEKKPNIMINIMLAVLCVSCSAVLFGELNKLTLIVKDHAVGTVSDQKIDQAYATVGVNIVDLVAVDKSHSNGLLDMNYSDGTGVKRLDTLSEVEFDKIDYTEVLNRKSDRHSFKSATKRVLKHRLIKDPSGDVLVELNNGFGWNSADDADIGNEFYYRYHLDWLSAWLELLALMLIYLTMSYKCVRVVFELIVARVLASLYSAELSGGEKVKKILVFIRDSYILLIVTAICIKVYFFMNALIATTAGLNGVVKGFFCLFIAFAVIDGPNLVEKLLGMDAGLKSSTARWFAMGRAVSEVAKRLSAKSLAQSAQNIKSGDMAKGGIAAGAVGAAIGKEVSNDDAGTHREGGILAAMRSRGSDSGDSGGAGGGGSTSGGSASTAGSGSGTGRGEKGDKGDKGDRGDRGSIGMRGDTGSQGDKGDRGMDANLPAKDYAEKPAGASPIPSSQDGAGGGDPHAFMNTRSSQSIDSGSPSGGAMPKRSTSSSSNLLNKKDGDE